MLRELAQLDASKGDPDRTRRVAGGARLGTNETSAVDRVGPARWQRERRAVHPAQAGWNVSRENRCATAKARSIVRGLIGAHVEALVLLSTEEVSLCLDPQVQGKRFVLYLRPFEGIKRRNLLMLVK
jgi:hypothetical protein